MNRKTISFSCENNHSDNSADTNNGTVSYHPGMYGDKEFKKLQAYVNYYKSKDIYIDIKSVVSVYSNKDETLASCTLLKKTKLNGIVFPERTTCYFRENGKLSYVFLVQNIQIGELLFMKGYCVFFHNNGKVSAGTIAEVSTLSGISFPIETDLYFSAQGKAYMAQIDKMVFVHEDCEYPLFQKDWNVGGVLIKMREKEAGKLYELEQPLCYKGVVYPAGSNYEFDGDNRLLEIELSGPILIGDHPKYSKNTIIKINEQGIPKRR